MFFSFGGALRKELLYERSRTDPHSNINIEKLHSYKIEKLRGWLLHRGDSLRGIHTVTHAQLK